MIKSSWPNFDNDEKAAVQAVLTSGKVNYWTGNECKKFEKEFSEYIGVDYGIAVSNGTTAIELALSACGVGVGDEVITTCRTFVGTAMPISIRGAVPIIADVERESQNISAATIEPYITKKTKAVICVHLAGVPCDMDPILELAKKHNLWIIEDCAQAHGASYKGRKVGSIGHIGTFSFCQDKIMTTGGEGGMLTTSDKDLWSKAWSFKDHGKSYGSVFDKEHAPGFRWFHESFGTNMRMTEMQAAIGRCQFRKLDTWLLKRRQNAACLARFLSRYDFIDIYTVPYDRESAYYKFYAFINDRLPTGLTREDVAKAFRNKGLFCIEGACFNITYEKAFEIYPNEYRKTLENAAYLGGRSLMFVVDHTVRYTDDSLILCDIVGEFK